MKLVEFQKIAEMLAKQHKITIHEGERWAANINQRKIFYIKDDIYNLPEDHILGLLLHEIAHIHYTSDVELPKENKEILHTTLNMIEDIAIEHIIGGDYPNAAEILESTKDEVLDTLVKLLPKLDRSIHEKAILYAAARFENRGYKNGIEDYEILGNKVADIMIPRKDEIFNRPDTEALMPMVEEIAKLLVQEAGEPTEHEKNQMMSEEQHGQANENGKEHDHDDEKCAGNPVKQDIIDALKAGNGWKPGLKAARKISFVDEIAEQADKMGKQLRSILKRNNSMEFGGRYRTGKLKTKRIIKVVAQKDRNPFTRRIVKSNQSYAFAVAIDVSGSMFENNYSKKPKPNKGSYALSSLYMIGEALRKASIPRSMSLFGVYATKLNEIDKKEVRWEEITDEQQHRKACDMGTNIDAGMKLGINELEKVRAERKILIILTDGISHQDEMEDQHKRGEKLGIEQLAITISDDRSAIELMNDVFGKEKNTIIEDVADTKLIGKAFIDILKASVKKSI